MDIDELTRLPLPLPFRQSAAPAPAGCRQLGRSKRDRARNDRAPGIDETGSDRMNPTPDRAEQQRTFRIQPAGRPPEDLRFVSYLRNRLYRQKGEYVVELIRLIHAGSVCELEFLREFVDKPKMRRWIREYDGELFGAIFENL